MIIGFCVILRPKLTRHGGSVAPKLLQIVLVLVLVLERFQQTQRRGVRKETQR